MRAHRFAKLRLVIFRQGLHLRDQPGKRRADFMGAGVQKYPLTIQNLARAQ